MSSPANLAGGVTVGVAPSAVAEVVPSANLAEVASSADLAGDVTVGVTSLSDPASVVTAGVAFKEKCGNSALIPSDCVCHYNDIYEMAISADLTGDVVVGVTSLADPVSVVTPCVAFREECEDSVVAWFVIMMTIFMMDDKPDYFDYDDPGDYDSYPSVVWLCWAG